MATGNKESTFVLLFLNSEFFQQIYHIFQNKLNASILYKMHCFIRYKKIFKLYVFLRIHLDKNICYFVNINFYRILF